MKHQRQLLPSDPPLAQLTFFRFTLIRHYCFYWNDSSLGQEKNHRRRGLVCLLIPLSLGWAVTALWKHRYGLWWGITLDWSVSASAVSQSDPGDHEWGKKRRLCDCCCGDISNALFYCNAFCRAEIMTAVHIWPFIPPWSWLWLRQSCVGVTSVAMNRIEMKAGRPAWIQ